MTDHRITDGRSEGEIGADLRLLVAYASTECKRAARSRLVADVPDLLAEVARLCGVVQDLADHGLRFDLNPTMDCRDVGTLFANFAAYLHRVDDEIRRRARSALESGAA